MSALQNHAAALEAEVARLRGENAMLRADLGHLRCVLSERFERRWHHEDWGGVATARVATDDYVQGRHGGTGFCPGGVL